MTNPSSPASPALLDPFAAALADVEEKALALRRSLIELRAAIPAEEGQWVATMTSAPVMQGLGAVVLICDGNAAWIHQWTDQITGALANGSVGSDLVMRGVAEEIAEGMARSALSCECNACPFCAGKTHRITEAERSQALVAMFRSNVQIAPRRSRIVGPHGRPMS